MTRRANLNAIGQSDGELDRIRTCELLWSLGRALYPLSYQPLSHFSI